MRLAFQIIVLDPYQLQYYIMALDIARHFNVDLFTADLTEVIVSFAGDRKEFEDAAGVCIANVNTWQYGCATWFEARRV